MSTDSQRSTLAPRRHPAITFLLILLTVALIVLHQDWWFWTDARLILGFIPIGLAYHAAYCVACSILMGLLVLLAWPRHLESLEQHASTQNSGDH